MTDRPEEVQQDLFRHLLASNRHTAFGKVHGFSSIGSWQAYQECVPVADYEATRPWVDRLQASEHRVLTEEQPYMFTMTSGTTGKPKLIPATGITRRCSSHLSAQWLYRSLVDHPRMLDSRALVIVSPAVEGHTPSGVAYGSASGHMYQNASRAVRSRYAVPYDVFAIKDFDAKYYAIMRFAIEKKVSFVATPNPSTILRLVNIADTHRNQLVRDVPDGSLSKNVDIPLEIRRSLEQRLKPDRERARELARLSSGEAFTPQQYWPGLALVGCRKGGSVGAALDSLSPNPPKDGVLGGLLKKQKGAPLNLG